MELTASGTHQPTGKRHRRWWLFIPFFIIAAVVVLGIAVFAKPSTNQFQFLTGAILQSDREEIHTNTPGMPTYTASTIYVSLQSRFDYRAELMSRGWIDEGEISETKIFKDSANEVRILVTEAGDDRAVVIHEIRPANFADRVRVWLKDRLPFLSRTPQPRTQ